MEKNKIEKIIFESIKELNLQLPSERQLTTSMDTILFGNGAKLDSLGLVTLLVIIEQNIEDEYNIVLTIADEKAMSQKNSPFRTIESLSKYIYLILDEESDNEAEN